MTQDSCAFMRLFAATLFGSFALAFAADALPRAEWGAPQVSVSQSGTTWIIAGQKNSATLDARTLALTVRAGNVMWAMLASGPRDLEIKLAATGEKFFVRLADAG